MGSFNRDDRSGGGFRRGGRSSFGGPRSFDRGGDRGNRPLFSATCSNCGKEAQVPFRPTNGKPVYCSDCFEKMGNRGQDSGRPERQSFRPQNSSGFDQNKATLDAINAKLDKILSILQPKVEISEIQNPTEKTAEVKVPKAKKVSKKPASSKKK